ncbi:SEC-C domain-containing protein [Mesorhizobium sp. B4-1-3]|uniref:SEC-C domain-containing protein n=1 Tax=Mesorhizobium sp. B4-1-3 TaxID=2589889 RepID=UPI00112D8BD3|nr:SEC-C domain-containing protein [Mesorhizobium sp. B4-1-3]TPI12217.1 SEC-C domain-containing protein [Mesorhizobium sp. B4-1-3]
MLTLKEVKAAIAFDQPKLRATAADRRILVEGSYLVSERDVVAAPDGPIAEFNIRMELPDLYPRREPKVFEVGGRIPRNPDRHINPDGDCCVTVWENWLAASRDHSFGSFLKGPLSEYFLGQFWFEKTGKWPFGERPHGLKGLEEAYADALGIANKRESLLYHLRLLSQDWPKGHWPCPCGSGKALRRCHHQDLMAMHRRVPPDIARRMLLRLDPKN